MNRTKKRLAAHIVPAFAAVVATVRGTEPKELLATAYRSVGSTQRKAA